MNDYYGTIMIGSEEVLTNLQLFFQREENGGYTVALIKDIVQELRQTDVIRDTYSVTGWKIYGFGNAVHSVRQAIHERMRKNERKLAFMRGVVATKATEETLPCDDILRKIAESM